jgi:hypothetical protein
MANASRLDSAITSFNGAMLQLNPKKELSPADNGKAIRLIALGLKISPRH